jgi:hypothetical protein
LQLTDIIADRRHRQLLRSLAVALHGRDVNVLLTLRFKLEIMADLIGGGPAGVTVEVVNDGGLKIAVAYVRITSGRPKGAQTFDVA